MSKDGPVESYIVRIYRRDAGRSTRVHGIVEQVGTDSRRSFRSMHELVAALGTAQGPHPRASSLPTAATARARRTKT
jgi:hypothetical protein